MEVSGSRGSQRGSVSVVIESLRDVINAQQTDNHHEPTPTEYFAVLLATIGTSVESDHLTSILSILDAVIPQSSELIVKTHFKQLGSTLMKIAKLAASNEDEGEGSSSEYSKILRLSLSCLGSAMIRIQDFSDGFWGGLLSLQSINALLAFLDDGRMKLRRMAQEKLTDLMISHKRSNAKAVRSYIADFCIGVLKTCTRSEYKRSLLLFPFLESTCALFPEAQTLQLIETSLGLQVCEQPVLTAVVFRMIDAFFQSPRLSLSAEQVRTCLEFLLDMKPNIADMESNTYYCTAVASGLIALHKRKHEYSSTLLQNCITALIDGCETDFTQIHCAVASAIKRIMSECVYTNVAKTELVPGLTETITLMESLCELRYQHTWLYIMDCFRSLFQQFNVSAVVEGSSSSSSSSSKPAYIMSSIVIKIAELYQAIENGVVKVDNGVQVALGDTLGFALRSCGVKIFLTLVPLRDQAATPEFVGVDESREWILNILHDNLKLMPCKLSDFNEIILGVAKACSQAVKNPLKFSLTELQTQIVRNRVVQMWSLFPQFCYCRPLDIVASMPHLAKLLNGALKDQSYPEIQPYIVTGLGHLAQGAKDRNYGAEIAALQPHAQTFLPTIFGILETIDICDNRFSSVVQCISAWAGIAHQSLTSAIATKLLQSLLSTTSSSMMVNTTHHQSQEQAESVIISGWIAILQAIIPFLPENMIMLIYRTIRPLLTVTVDASLQKRAYALLDSLLSSHGNVLFSNESKSAILSVVSDSLLICQVSARSMRLRCMETLISSMEDEEEISSASYNILGEVLICQKDANKKTRDSAMALLKIMVRRLPPNDLFVKLCSAIVGETSIMRSSALIAICMLLFEQRTDEQLLNSAADLLPSICLLLGEQCAETSRAVMSFLRVCSSVFPLPLLNIVLATLVQAFTSELGPMKSKFASRSRAIMRKLSQRLGGCEQLRPLVPEADQALLGYIQKQARRAARKKESKAKKEAALERMLGSDSENDSQGDDDEDDEDRVAIDPRFTSRPKAIFASSEQGYVARNLPTTFGDLLEDQGPSFNNSTKGSGGAGGGKSRNNDLEEEDDDYRVIVTKDGRVCVQEKVVNDETGPASNPQNQPLKRHEMSGPDSEGQSGGGGAVASKKRKMKEPGEEYRSKKAGGDVWKRGMLEPHAFIPLDPRLLSSKHKDDAMQTFGAVVKGKTNKKSAGHGASERKGHVVVGNRKQRESRKEHSREMRQRRMEEQQQQSEAGGKREKKEYDPFKW